MLADWVEDETQSADFGDVRLDKRYKRLIADIYDRSRNSLPAACGGWKETLAAYRFFDNENVNLEGVLASHYEATLTRISASNVVLIAQDDVPYLMNHSRYTTQLVREKTKKTEVIKGIRAKEKDKTYLHANVAFTTERVCLGVIKVAHWKREGKKDKAAQVKKPIEEKESIRWLDGYEAACAVQAHSPDTLIVSVSDRESDIHELFLDAQTYETHTRAGWIVRSMHDRLVEDEHSCKLREYLEKTPIKGHTEFTLPANGERKSRSVKQTIQAAIVPLKAVSRPGKELAGTNIHAILVKEQTPPAGEDAIEWVLLTNLPIDSLAEIETIIQWVVCRWEIEIYFRVLKNGCQVQKLQLEPTVGALGDPSTF